MKGAILLIIILSSGCTSSEPLKIGSKMPLANNDIKEGVLGGKVVLVEFYASWCVPCRQEEAIIEGLKPNYEGQVVFVKLDTEEDKRSVKKFGKFYLPEIIIADKNGIITYISIGLTPKEKIEEELKKALETNTGPS